MAKPDFTGIWQFNPSKSLLQIPAPESTTFFIEHREPCFRLERTHVFDGNSDTFSIELATDGKPVALNHRGLEIRASLNWEGETLLFYSTVERDGVQATNIVRYRLLEDGQVFIAEEQFRSQEMNYENRWVFDKK
jgi:hypothetical protein